jgi:hypothetical protein
MERSSGLSRALAVALLVVGTAAAEAGPPRSAPMTKVEISVPGRPNAVCNDGTKPIMYYQPGTGADRNKWVIYFQGGGGCASDAACMARARDSRDLTTSVDDNLPPTITGDGILSTVPAVNPDLAGFSHVFLHYCSSDAYAGDAERRIGPATWQFRGKEIVAAMIDQLASPSDPSQPSLKAATDVLVTGGSAGAMGVASNLDRIAEQLPQARVRGIADAGWMPAGVRPYGPGTFDVRPDSPEAFAYYNGQADASCVAANPDRPGACLSQSFAFPHIKTPMLVVVDQNDPALLSVVGAVPRPTSVAEREYVSDYIRRVRESLADVPAYFIGDGERHTVLLHPRFATMAAGGQTLGSVLRNWFFETGGPVRAMAPAPGTSTAR